MITVEQARGSRALENVVCVCVCLCVCVHACVWSDTYLLLDQLSGLVVEYGPEAVLVCCSLRVQAEIQRHKDGRQLVSELPLILHSTTETDIGKGIDG